MDTLTERKLHVMREMNQAGDEVVIEWDPNNANSVRIAKETFQEKKEKGYSMFRSDRGEKGVRMDTFDPQAKRIIIVQRIVGG